MIRREDGGIVDSDRALLKNMVESFAAKMLSRSVQEVIHALNCRQLLRKEREGIVVYVTLTPTHSQIVGKVEYALEHLLDI